MKFKILKIFIATASMFVYFSCANYLDVIPDNIPTIEHAFSNRYQAEGFLFGCFSYLPAHGNVNANPALVGGDEIWLIDPLSGLDPILWGIARGEQGTNEPLANYWTSQQEKIALNGGKNFFTGLRDCNIFLENIYLPFDLEEWERDQWIAEVKFVKAYLYFWLFRMYGPIPLIKTNIDIDSPADDVQIYREPIDDVVDYMVELLDDCSKDLPLEIYDEINDLGRPSRPMALALKAQILTYAASPLFNGNTDYADMIDNRGLILFPQEYKKEKWERAASALKDAIDVCHEAKHKLFDFHESIYSKTLNEATIMAMQVRGAATERWNKEIIFGDSNTDVNQLQRLCQPAFTAPNAGASILFSGAPPLRIVEQFYSKNGVPIDEDTEWQEVDWYGFRTGTEAEKYYIKPGFETINLHFNREARFYGAISFDGGKFYGNGKHLSDNDLNTTYFQYGQSNFVSTKHSSTGYLAKKMIHYLSAAPPTERNLNEYRYAFPVIRLADLYLMYAEALNEIKDIPDAEVYEYIDLVRSRTGLKGVLESWQNFSVKPDKPKTQEGMREIIRRERLNELAFEGSRFWDLRRWKMAEEYLNKPIKGLNKYGEEPEEFYKIQNVFELKFEKKDYLWPIQQRELLRNKNLLQNPGW